MPYPDGYSESEPDEINQTGQNDEEQTLEQELESPSLSEFDDEEEEDELEELPLTEAERVEIEAEFPVSAEPLPVAVESLVPGETVINDQEDLDKGHLTELVCEACLELNLTSKSAIVCARCGKAFCLHYASTIDVQYCVNCMSDVGITKEVITKTYEHKSAETDQVTFYRRRARQMRIFGLDWLFAQRKINDLSDVELDLDIEYHRNLMKLMIDEQERRKNEKMHRYAGMRVVLPTPATTTVSSVKQTTVKKSSTVSKSKSTEQLQALLSSMKAKGVTMESLAQLLKKK